MGFLWTVTICWLVFICLFQSSINSGFFKFILMIVAIAPMGLLAWYVATRTNKRLSNHESMLQAAGVSPSDGRDHAEGGTGIALNKAAKTITLRNREVWKTYPYTDVREWETRVERAGQIVGAGGAPGLVGVAVAFRADRDLDPAGAAVWKSVV